MLPCRDRADITAESCLARIADIQQRCLRHPASERDCGVRYRKDADHKFGGPRYLLRASAHRTLRNKREVCATRRHNRSRYQPTLALRGGQMYAAKRDGS